MAAKIRTEGLSAWYGTKLAIQDITMDFEEHSVTAIIGPSGCGKSTLIRCMNRMHEINARATFSGEIRLDGENIFAMDPVLLRRKVGMVFQRPNPFPTMTIHQNVAAGLVLNGMRDK